MSDTSRARRIPVRIMIWSPFLGVSGLVHVRIRPTNIERVSRFALPLRLLLGSLHLTLRRGLARVISGLALRDFIVGAGSRTLRFLGVQDSPVEVLLVAVFLVLIRCLQVGNGAVIPDLPYDCRGLADGRWQLGGCLDCPEGGLAQLAD